MRKANPEIRALMRQNHVPAWALAEFFGVHENTVLHRLRVELSAAEAARYAAAIEAIAAAEAEAEREEANANA